MECLPWRGKLVERKKAVGVGKHEEVEEEEEPQQEEPQSESSKGRKRRGEAIVVERQRKRSTTPFSVPPSKLTKKTFQLCNPFVTITFSEDWEGVPGDKVCDSQRMDNAALTTSIMAMFPQQDTMSRAFKEASTESGTRALHLAVAAGFRVITTPRQKVSTCPSTTMDIIQQIDKAREESEKERETLVNEDNEDLSIARGGVFTTLMGKESNESLNVRHEGDDGEDGGTETKYDLNFLVHDKRIKGVDKKVTVLVVDCKQDGLSKGVWQVSSYGCKYAVLNMEKGRFEPIFLELWGDRLWRYAMLCPTGIVFVEEGEVSGSFGSSSSNENLNKKLHSAQKHLNVSYPGIGYPDGSYVQGLLYVSRQKFTLPDFATGRFTNVEDIKLFYQSKIRMIVGDKALQWTSEEVKERIAIRKEEEKHICDDLENALLNNRV